ncbi:MAG: hypothetical protein AAF517_10535 [Planctomycetota bacterium]
MKATARQRITTALTLVTISLVVYLAVTQGNQLVVTWKIDQLDSEDPQIRDAAATWLGERKVARAVPKLVELLFRDPPALGPVNTQTTTNSTASTLEPLKYHIEPKAVAAALIQIGEPAAEALVARWHPARSAMSARWTDHLGVAFFGSEALPPLLRCVEQHEDRGCLSITLEILWVLAENRDLASEVEGALLTRADRENPANRRQIMELVNDLRGGRPRLQTLSGTTTTAK